MVLSLHPRLLLLSHPENKKHQAIESGDVEIFNKKKRVGQKAFFIVDDRIFYSKI